MQHKYVRHTKVGFVLWPARNGADEDVTHRDIARTTCRQNAGGEIISAGFVTISGSGTITCGGFSESLGMGFRTDDEQALATQLFNRT